MTFRQKLEALMSDRTKASVARKADIHPTALTSYLKRGITPGSDVAVRLARALGVDIGWLIDDRRDWPPVRVEEPVPPTPTANAA